MKLTEDERSILNAIAENEGRLSLIQVDSRIALKLERRGLIKSYDRGYTPCWCITEKGRDVLPVELPEVCCGIRHQARLGQSLRRRSRKRKIIEETGTRLTDAG